MPKASRTRPKFATVKAKPLPEIDVPVGAIVVWTDGSCTGNGGRHAKGGYSCVVKDAGSDKVSPTLSGGWPLLDGVVPTNNRAEFSGFIKATQIADQLDPPRDDPKDNRTLLVVTDSELLQKTVMSWLASWRKKGWVRADGKPVANQDLCKTMLAVCERRAIVVKHVRAHTDGEDEDSVMNRRADQLATTACATQAPVKA
jgi:ribonuclease HI